MYGNSNGMSNGKALLLTLAILVFIGWIIGLTEPKCKHSGCDNNAKEDSNYCWKHDDSWGSYKSYSTSYDSDGDSYLSVKSTTSYGESSYTSSDDSNYSTNSSSGYSSSGSSTKKSSMDSYDEGYEDVYDDYDYDWDRYQNDDDYANGVDDAMDDEEEEGW